jgi:hypothetical protein
MPMNLADMLSFADIAQLMRIAETYDCRSTNHSKNELIQSILSAVQKRDVLERKVDAMSPEDLRLLNSLLFEPREMYSLEDLTARALWTASDTHAGAARPEAGEEANKPAVAVRTTRQAEPKSAKQRKRPKPDAAEPAPQAPEQSARHAIVRFMRYGWLFNGITQHTRYLYQVPEDVKRRLCEVLEVRFRAVLDVRGEPEAYRDEGTLLSADAVLFLRFVRDHDVALTTEGYMYKRQLGQVLGLLSVSEGLPARTAWRFGYGRRFREYPERFSLLYDYCCHRNWLRENGERLELTDAGLLAAAGDVAAEPSDLYRFWLRAYRVPVPNIMAVAQWTIRLASAWTTVASLGKALLPLVRPYYYDSAEDVLNRRVLKMMVHLGLLRWGEASDGTALVRVTPLAAQMVPAGDAGRKRNANA